MNTTIKIKKKSLWQEFGLVLVRTEKNVNRCGAMWKRSRTVLKYEYLIYLKPFGNALRVVCMLARKYI